MLGGVLATSDQNAHRFLGTLLKRFDLSLKVPVSEYVYTEAGETATLPWLRPSDFLPNLLQHNADLLLGGFHPGRQAQSMLRTFWSQYSLDHPSHPVIARGSAFWGCCIPLAIHGDGGRTQKKQPLEIVAIESILGIDSASALSCQCSCPRPMVVGAANPSDPRAQRLNCRHASYLSKYLVFAYPSKKYGKLPGLLKALHQAACADLADICSRGVLVDQTRYFFGVVGYKGDFEWHNKIVDYTRNYVHLGHTNELGCCPECAGGTPGVPFEDISSQAVWTRTICKDIPWRTDPPVTDLEFDNWHATPSKAALFFRRDPFHVFRHGFLAYICFSIYILQFYCCTLVL